MVRISWRIIPLDVPGSVIGVSINPLFQDLKGLSNRVPTSNVWWHVFITFPPQNIGNPVVSPMFGRTRSDFSNSNTTSLRLPNWANGTEPRKSTTFFRLNNMVVLLLFLFHERQEQLQLLRIPMKRGGTSSTSRKKITTNQHLLNKHR